MAFRGKGQDEMVENQKQLGRLDRGGWSFSVAATTSSSLGGLKG